MNNPLAVAVIAVLVFGVGFVVGRGADSTNAIFDFDANDSDRNGASIIDRDNDNNDNDDNDSVADRNAHLTADQRKFLAEVGVDTDNITITPSMMACAEARLGAERMAAIKDGAQVSVSEGVDLLACYNTN